MMQHALQDTAVSVDVDTAEAKQHAVRLLQLGLTTNDDMRYEA